MSLGLLFAAFPSLSSGKFLSFCWFIFAVMVSGLVTEISHVRSAPHFDKTPFAFVCVSEYFSSHKRSKCLVIMPFVLDWKCM